MDLNFKGPSYDELYYKLYNESCLQVVTIVCTHSLYISALLTIKENNVQSIFCILFGGKSSWNEVIPM